MSTRILKAALMLATCLPALAFAQNGNREGSLEFSVSGGMFMIDPALRDFLGSGPPESRFSASARANQGVATAVGQLGYNFTRHLGLSISVGDAASSGLKFLNIGEAVTFTRNLNAKTSPFVLVGTELTRIDGKNDRVTHSTWGAFGGIGLRHMVSENVAFRPEFRLRIEGYNEVPMRKHTTFSPLFQIGFSYFRHAKLP
jgi:outer membrane protein with beta-barrel domain